MMKKSVNKIKKTDYVQTRIDPQIKEKTENILHQLGISPSQAINMFYYQIYMKGGIPFDLTVPDFMTEEEEKKVALSRKQVENGEYYLYDPSKNISIEEFLEESV